MEDLLERIEEEELEMVKLGNQLFLDPSNVILQDQLASILDSMNQIWKDIAIQKNDKSWQNLTQANRENGQAIVAAFKVPDTEDALLKNLAYQATTKTLKQRALEMMEKSDDLSTRKNIQGHLIAIGTDLDKVQNLISSLAKDPKNAQNIKDLSTNLDNIDDKWSQLGESNLKTVRFKLT